MFKKRNRNKLEESNLQPNEALEIDAFSEYQNVFTKGKDAGYRGLLAASNAKTLVRLVVQKSEEETEELEGTVSHYDENYAQLVLVVENSLRRLTFDQIIDATLPDGGALSNEEFSD